MAALGANKALLQVQLSFYFYIHGWFDSYQFVWVTMVTNSN